MLTTLIRRELLDTLIAFRFGAAVFILLLLVVANTFVLMKDYDRRLASYHTAVKANHDQVREGKTYSSVTLDVVRPPNLLSLFNVGLDKRLNTEIFISYSLVPSLWDGQKHGSTNPLLDIFSTIDIVFIFEVVLSLMALIFAYDALAGERERGTLRLVLAYPVSRGHILLAKYVSAMICLLLPVLMSFLFVMILLTTSPTVSLNVDDFLCIGGIVLSSLVYLSVFYLVGLLISAVTGRTGTALMLAMFIWGFWVFVYPNVILVAVNPAPPSQAPLESAFNQIEQIWEAFDRERKHFLANDPVPGADPHFGLEGADPHFNMVGGSGFTFEFWHKSKPTLLYVYVAGSNIEALPEEFEPQVPHVRDYYRFLVPLLIDAAERTWRVRRPVLESVFFQPARVDRIFLKFSPVGMYDAATQALAGTDLSGLSEFYEATRKYRRTVIDALYDKNAFEDRRWFSADRGAVDWESFPQFSFQRSGFSIKVKRALPDLFRMLLMTFVLFWVIFLVFQRSEV